MGKSKKPYKKISGYEARLFQGRYSLWQGPDHVLSIFSNGISERYKRFYYREIQTIVVTDTPRGKILNIILSIISGFFLILGVANSEYYFIPAPFFILALLINWIKGTTCVCKIQTEVQTEKLPSLSRKRGALKVIAAIEQLIENAQEDINQKQISPAP